MEARGVVQLVGDLGRHRAERGVPLELEGALPVLGELQLSGVTSSRRAREALLAGLEALEHRVGEPLHHQRFRDAGRHRLEGCMQLGDIRGVEVRRCRAQDLGEICHHRRVEAPDRQEVPVALRWLLAGDQLAPEQHGAEATGEREHEPLPRQLVLLSHHDVAHRGDLFVRIGGEHDRTPAGVGCQRLVPCPLHGPVARPLEAGDDRGLQILHEDLILQGVAQVGQGPLRQRRGCDAVVHHLEEAQQQRARPIRALRPLSAFPRLCRLHLGPPGPGAACPVSARRKSGASLLSIEGVEQFPHVGVLVVEGTPGADAAAAVEDQLRALLGCQLGERGCDGLGRLPGEHRSTGQLGQ